MCDGVVWYEVWPELGLEAVRVRVRVRKEENKLIFNLMRNKKEKTKMRNTRVYYY